MKYCFLLLCLLTLFLVAPINTLACSCGMSELESPDDLRREMSQFGAVFSGQVLEIRQVSKYVQDVKFKLEKSWRGASSETITVAIETYTNCGYPFKVGQNYLVFAYASAEI